MRGPGCCVTWPTSWASLRGCRRQRRRPRSGGGHDRGQALVDMAVAIADGATTFSDLRVLIPQPDLFGEVASVSTTWRTLDR